MAAGSSNLVELSDVYPKSLRRVISAFAERAGLGKLAPGLRNVGALAPEVIGNRAAQIGIGDVMRGIRGLRQISARQLVLALRAGFDRLQSALDREIDRLIITHLEMQERVMLDRAPVAAEQRVRADEIDGAGDPAAV